MKPRGRAGGAAGAGGAGESRTRDLAILNAIAEALNSAADVQQALERTLALVAGLLGLRTGWIWLLDPETGQFYSAAVRNLPPYLQEPVRMAGRRCWCIDEFFAGDLTPKNIDVMECSRLRSALDDRDLARAADATHGLRYHASIPLYFQDQPLGIMNLTGPAWRRLTRQELHLLSTIAYQVGIAVERARLAEAGARLARAEERARIAREIHDTLAQGLTAIGLHLEGALRHLDGDPQRARDRLQRALDMTRDSLEAARRSVLNLRAADLAGRPLPEALAALARAFTSETGVRVHVRSTNSTGSTGPTGDAGAAVQPGQAGDTTLPLRVEAELFGIAQEALANVRKHANAKEVEITLRTTPGAVRLSIRDDGQGLDRRRANPDGYGIQGMRERARLLGGTLRVLSRPGRGTTVVASAPLPSGRGAA